MGRFAHFYKALKFKTCRTLLSNVWDKELTLIQRRILGTLRNEKRLDTQVSRKQNSIAYIKLQTARKLNLFYRNMRSMEWKKGRSQRYIPFLLHLETRLDVLLVRIHFCENLVQARQLISHGKVCVNHAVTNKIHWKVSPGSIISFKEDAGITQQTELNVKTATGKTITLEVNSSDSVNDVKEKIAAKEGIPTNLQQLVYAGRRLEDGQILRSCALERGPGLHLVLC